MREMKLRTTALSCALILGATAGCSSIDRTSIGKKDPFSDPSRFESLASAAQEYTASSAVGSPSAGTAPADASAPAPIEAVGVRFEADVAREPATTATVLADEIKTPEGAFAEMARGNERFITGAIRGAHRDAERRRSLASAQKPHTVVLSCSDSRVPPELIFDQGLGDITTIRVEGNILGSGQVASIEYAVEHLGSKLILVMGHESCGAVKAALSVPSAHDRMQAKSVDMQWVISSIKPNLATRGIASTPAYDSSHDPKFRKPVMANVDAVTEQLLVRSKTISQAIEKGNLRIVKGIYSLESGRVDFWGTK